MHAKGTFSRRCGLISDREDMLVRRLPANSSPIFCNTTSAAHHRHAGERLLFEVELGS